MRGTGRVGPLIDNAFRQTRQGFIDTPHDAAGKLGVPDIDQVGPRNWRRPASTSMRLFPESRRLADAKKAVGSRATAFDHRLDAGAFIACCQ